MTSRCCLLAGAQHDCSMGVEPRPRASHRVSLSSSPCLLPAGSLISCLHYCSVLQVQGLHMSLNPPQGRWSQLSLTILALILMSLSFSGAWGIFFLNLTMYFKSIFVGFIQHFCVSVVVEKMTLYHLSVLFCQRSILKLASLLVLVFFLTFNIVRLYID